MTDNALERFEGLLRRELPGLIYLRGEPMAAHTTFKVGGPADFLAQVEDAGQLAGLLALCRREGVPALMMGNGSNLLVRDGGIRGVVIQCGPGLSQMDVAGEVITAGAGCMLSALSRLARDHSLAGLAFAAGIPGCLGGALVMNAGAYGGQMADVVESVQALDEGLEPVVLSGAELELGYRRSVFMRRGLFILSARLRLTPGDREAIAADMAEYQRRRREKQPLTLPSAGSTFKRPEGHFAGALIQQAGLMGLRVGGASVSTLHAGFVVNDQGGTAQDIERLIALIRQRVHENSGVWLTPEVRIVGEV